MNEGEVALKMLPRLVSFRVTFPYFGVIEEHAGCINKLIGGGDDLFGRVQTASGCIKVDRIFNLVKQGFDKEIEVLSIF